MPRLFCLIACLLVLGALRTQPVAQEARPTLSVDLQQMRDAWIGSDDVEAEARAKALNGDSRLSGELPRWYAGFEAALKLKRGDAAGALEALRKPLTTVRDARGYIRSTRLLLAFGRLAEALILVREGKTRHADSSSLLRLEADLLWLSNEPELAMAAYADLAAASTAARYPYELSTVRSWAQVEPWPECGESKSLPSALDDEWRGRRRGGDLPQGKIEPFNSLCTSPVWFETDMPGLERCIMECSIDVKRAEAAAGRVAQRLADFVLARDAVDASTGTEDRVKRTQNLRRFQLLAFADLRIAALHQFNQKNPSEAEQILGKGLAYVPTDVAMLDLLVQVQAAQGKAEEARQALSELNRSAGLKLGNWPHELAGLGMQAFDRVFDAARALAKVNEVSGKAQLEALRTTMGNGDESPMIEPGNLGLWLQIKGEPILAKHYLAEAARAHPLDAGLNDSAAWEMGLLTLILAELQGNPPAPEAANPWIELAPRVGALQAQALDLPVFIQRLGHTGLYSNPREDALYQGAKLAPANFEALPALLFDMPARFAASLKPAELDAMLAADSPQSKQLQTALEQFAALLEQAKGDDWDVREKATQRVYTVTCALQTRALLIRAKLAQQPPASLAELSTWLEKQQVLLDLRRVVKSVPMSEADVRLTQKRAALRIPEIHHSALLLDCALILARKGAYADAANLLLLNPAPILCDDSHARRMTLAALFFRKAGKPDLEFQARLSALEVRRVHNLWLLEFTRARLEILEFGQSADVVDYIENQYVPRLRGASIARLISAAPELKTADSSLWLRNAPADGSLILFGSSLQRGNVANIVDNWPKVLATNDPMGVAWRLAAWCLISDLPSVQRWDAPGLADTQECLNYWQLLAQAHAGSGRKEDKAAGEKLALLVKRCGGSIDSESIEEYYGDND